MRVHENPALYEPRSDAVAVITLTVECHPKQLDALETELVNIRDKAGVYSVDIDHDVRLPVPAPSEGETHGESPSQLADPAEAERVDGQGGDADDADEGHAVDDGEDGELAGPAGEGEPGSISGDAEVQDVPEVPRDVTD